MKYVNTHRRTIALLAMLSFLYLVHVTAMPSAAMPLPPTSDRAAVSSTADDGSGLIEQQAPTYRAKKSKSSPIIPIVIGVVVVGAVVAVLVLVVFKTKYDITGSWKVWDSFYQDFYTLTFKGDKKSGSVSSPDFSDTGTYEVSGKDVKFSYSGGGSPLWIHTGKFESKTRMSGAITFQNEPGTWYADRQTAANPSASSPRVEKKNKIKK